MARISALFLYIFMCMVATSGASSQRAAEESCQDVDSQGLLQMQTRVHADVEVSEDEDADADDDDDDVPMIGRKPRFVQGRLPQVSYLEKVVKPTPVPEPVVGPVGPDDSLLQKKVVKPTPVPEPIVGPSGPDDSLLQTKESIVGVKAEISADGEQATVSFTFEGQHYNYELKARSVYSEKARINRHLKTGVETSTDGSDFSRSFQVYSAAQQAVAFVNKDGSVRGLFQQNGASLEVHPRSASESASLAQLQGRAHVVQRSELDSKVAEDPDLRVDYVPQANQSRNVLYKKADRAAGTSSALKYFSDAKTQFDGVPFYPGCYPNDEYKHQMLINIILDVAACSDPDYGPNCEGAKARAEDFIVKSNLIMMGQLNVEFVIDQLDMYMDSETAPAYANHNCSGTEFLGEILDLMTPGSSFAFVQVLTGCGPGHGWVGVAYLDQLCKYWNMGTSQLRSSYLTFLHEAGHTMGADHAFDLGQSETGGIMDYYVNGIYDGVVQFNPIYTKPDFCEHFTERYGCSSFVKTDELTGWTGTTTEYTGPPTTTTTTTTTTTLPPCEDGAANDNPCIHFGDNVCVECSELGGFCAGYDFVRNKCIYTCGNCPTPAPTLPPTTTLPPTPPPTTTAPPTPAPTTPPPTPAPTTPAPTPPPTTAPPTPAPTTPAPTTPAPTTPAPTTPAPTPAPTTAPPTPAPTTPAPTPAPTTPAPTTPAPTPAPTTPAPTPAPTTPAPTPAPTTPAPTPAPTTPAPTPAPTTPAPTTPAPTTPAPTPAPTTPAPTPPAPTDGGWHVVSGNCATYGSDACIASPGYPANYPDSDKCEIEVTDETIPISVEFWKVKGTGDWLMINGHKYNRGPNANNFPEGVIPSIQTIVWSSNGSGNRKGWLLCRET